MASFRSLNSNRHGSPQLFYNRWASGMASPEVLYNGVLLKSSGFNSFKSRYFVLYKNRKLAYWASQTEEIYGKDPLSVIEMKGVRAVKIVNKRSKKKKKDKNEGDAEDDIGDDVLIDFEKTRYFCFELCTKYRNYLLCCDDAVQFNFWISNLNNSIFGKKLYKGWLIKQGAKAKSWKKRWFVVFDTKEMRYYENSKHSKPKGQILLTDISQINLILDKDKYPKRDNVMELITPDRNWILSCPSLQDRDTWFIRLCKLMGECYRLDPIYDASLFQFNDTHNTWTQRHFALTPDHLYYFDNSDKCLQAKSNAYFDKAAFHIGISNYVQGFVPLNNPKFKTCNIDVCKVLNKQHLFEIDTSFSKIKFAASHKDDLHDWKDAYNKLKDLQMQAPQIPQPPSIMMSNFNNNGLNINKYIIKPLPKKLAKRHSTSQTLSNLSLKGLLTSAGIGGFKRKPNTDVINEGYAETVLPKPQPRRPSKLKLLKSAKNDNKNDDQIDQTNNIKPKPKHIKKNSKKQMNIVINNQDVKDINVSKKMNYNDFTQPVSDRKRQIGKGKSKGIGKAMRLKYKRDRKKSHSYDFGNLATGSIATSYNPKRNQHFIQSQQSDDFKFDKLAVDNNKNNDNSAYRDSISYNQLNHPNVNDSLGFTNLLGTMISPTPSRHGSFDVRGSMSNNYDPSVNRSLLNYNPSDTELSFDDKLINHSSHDNINKMNNDKQSSMLSSLPNPQIVLQLMELGFVSKTACEQAALAVNNRSTDEASQWLFNNLLNKNQQSDNPSPSSKNLGSDDDDKDVDDDNDNIIDSDQDDLFEYQQNDIQQKKKKLNLSITDQDKILSLKEASMRGDAYFDKQLWKEAIKEYTIALNAIDYDLEMDHPSAYTYYCFRSECYRKLKQLNKAEEDTELWMDLRWKAPDFDFLQGCDIGSKVYIDLNKYNNAKKLLLKGLQINPNKIQFKKRLKKVNKMLIKQLNDKRLEIDNLYLEYDANNDNDDIIVDVAVDDNLVSHKLNRAMKVIPEWKSLVSNKSINILESESKLIQCSADVIDCPCGVRLLILLKFYNKWCKTQATASILDRISIYSIIAYLEYYSLYQLINDYIHIKESHIDTQKQPRSEIYEYFIDKLEECDILSCRCFYRNNRNRNEIDCNEDQHQAMYFNFSRNDIKQHYDILTMRIFDCIHSFYIHAPECIMMKLPSNIPKDTSQEDILSDFLNTPQSALQFSDNNWNQKYLLRTNISNNDGDDDDDDKKDDNKQNDDNKFVEFDELIIGKNMKYWKSFKNNDFQNIYVKPKYKTLKREMLVNKICKITELEWKTTVLIAKIYKKTFRGKELIAKDLNDLNDKYDIPAGLPITISHIIVILLYLNNSNFQYQIKHRGYSLISSQETISSFKKRNREIVNFTKLLEECMRFYGSSNNIFMSSAIFYHALSEKTLLNNFSLIANSPIILTIEPSAAMITCGYKRNTVLQLKGNINSNILLFDGSWLSNRPYNYEYITTLSAYNILDIISDYQSNEIFISTISLFRKIINGFYIEDILHPQQLCQFISIGLMSNMSEGYKTHSNIPYFMQILFQYIVNKISSIWIIKSQFDKLSNDFRTCFFDIDDDENISNGLFYEYLLKKTNNKISVNMTQEFEWNINQQDDILKFWGLHQTEIMEGPQLNYYINNNDNDNDDNDNEQFIAFVPIICRSHNYYSDNVCLGIKLKQLPDNINAVELQYNIFQTQLKYTLSKTNIFKQGNEVSECVAFNINQIKALNSFHFQISLRVLSVA